MSQAMGPHFADEITVEKKADATYKVVGAGEMKLLLISVCLLSLLLVAYCAQPSLSSHHPLTFVLCLFCFSSGDDQRVSLPSKVETLCWIAINMVIILYIFSLQSNSF